MSNEISTICFLKKESPITRDELIKILLEHKKAYPNYNPNIVLDSRIINDDVDFETIIDEFYDGYAPLNGVCIEPQIGEYPDIPENYDGSKDLIELSFTTSDSWFNAFENKVKDKGITKINHCTDQIIE
jgi:hypothetical protein